MFYHHLLQCMLIQMRYVMIWIFYWDKVVLMPLWQQEVGASVLLSWNVPLSYLLHLDAPNTFMEKILELWKHTIMQVSSKWDWKAFENSNLNMMLKFPFWPLIRCPTFSQSKSSSMHQKRERKLQNLLCCRSCIWFCCLWWCCQHEILYSGLLLLWSRW